MVTSSPVRKRGKKGEKRSSAKIRNRRYGTFRGGWPAGPRRGRRRRVRFENSEWHPILGPAPIYPFIMYIIGLFPLLRCLAFRLHCFVVFLGVSPLPRLRAFGPLESIP